MNKEASTELHSNFIESRLNLRITIGICLGTFLFLIFFQPFQLQIADFNSKLLVHAAFGGITLILLSAMRILIPPAFSSAFSVNKWTVSKEIIYDFLFVVLNTVAYSFFARYVGNVNMNFHVVTILTIISITIIVIMVFANNYHKLKKQVRAFSAQAAKNNATIKKEENLEIQFESDNKSEYFKLNLNQIILIKSASNYVEVIYLKNDEIHKKLIRNTLKSTEQLLGKYKSLIRCHRSCIVNKNHIKEVKRGSDGLELKMSGYPGNIHVSRQYVMKVKEALKDNQ